MQVRARIPFLSLLAALPACSLVFPVDDFGRGALGETKPESPSDSDAQVVSAPVTSDASEGGDSGLAVDASVPDVLPDDARLVDGALDVGTLPEPELLASGQVNPTSLTALPMGILWTTDTEVNAIPRTGPNVLGARQTLWTGQGKKKLDAFWAPGPYLVVWSTDAELLGCKELFCGTGVDTLSSALGPLQSLATNGQSAFVVDANAELREKILTEASVPLVWGMSARDVIYMHDAGVRLWVDNSDVAGAKIASDVGPVATNLSRDTRQPRLGSMAGGTRVLWLSGTAPTASISECVFGGTCTPQTVYVGDVDIMTSDGDAIFWSTPFAGESLLRACRTRQNCSAQTLARSTSRILSVAALGDVLFFTTESGGVWRVSVPALP